MSGASSGPSLFKKCRMAALTGWAAKAVVEAKKIDPEVTLVLLLPYHPENRPMVPPKGFDGTYYPPDMGACATPCSPRQGEPLYG